MKFLEAHLTLNKVMINLCATKNESSFRNLQADKKLYPSFSRSLFVRHKQVTYLYGGKFSNHLRHLTTHSPQLTLYSLCPELSLVAFYTISTSIPHSSETDKTPHLLSDAHVSTLIWPYEYFSSSSLQSSAYHNYQLTELWHQEMTTVSMQCDNEKHECHIELSAKNMRSNNNIY